VGHPSLKVFQAAGHVSHRRALEVDFIRQPGNGDKTWLANQITQSTQKETASAALTAIRRIKHEFF
jgi:hypothetical protein